MDISRRNFLIAGCASPILPALAAFQKKPANFGKYYSQAQNSGTVLNINPTDYGYYKDTVQTFMSKVFPHLPMPSGAEAQVVEFGSYKGFVTNKLSAIYGPSRVTGIETHKYCEHPNIQYFDFAKSPELLPSKPLSLGWNGFRSWTKAPEHRSMALGYFSSKLVKGGLYISDDAYEIDHGKAPHKESYSRFGFERIYTYRFMAVFQKVV